MTLLPGCRICVAPKFHLDADWLTRISVGTGVEELEGKFFPRGPWRPPTSDELALLVAPSEPTPTSRGLPMLDARPVASPTHTHPPDNSLCLFQLPEHLRDAWWDLFDAAAEADEPVKGFDEFAEKVAEFLTFKQLNTSGTQMEVLVSAANERSIRVDPATGQLSGLGSTIAPWVVWPAREQGSVPRLSAVVNLGDEATGVVILNLTLSGLATELARCAPADPPPTTVGQLVARFLSTCPDYPLVRVRLGSGEGCWLPTEGLILDGDATGKEEPNVLLLISEEESALTR
ncbi:MAG: hypothetical protein L0241_10740 [Planctomycetia bacterium]|nr:hypothetical protein [Planctomycetia bacterium]